MKKTDEELTQILTKAAGVVNNYIQNIAFFRDRFSLVELKKEDFQLDFFDKDGKDAELSIGITSLGTFCVISYQYIPGTYTRPPDFKEHDLGILTPKIDTLLIELASKIAKVEVEEAIRFQRELEELSSFDVENETLPAVEVYRPGDSLPM